MSTQQNELKYFNAFNLFPEIGTIRFKKLLSYFPNLETAWQSPFQEFIQAGLDEKISQKICEERNKINPDKEFEKIAKQGIEIITIQNSSYPKILKEIYDPPAILYIKGKFKPEDDFCLAIIGTRKPTSYGIQVVTDLTHKLSTAGLTIVSGLARGIDTIAHKSCLSANGRTIAVIGSGIDPPSIYPQINRKLAEQISDNGAIISEYPIGTQAMPYHFPARNRIISGLSLGVLVIEAAQKSGTFLTANHALSQNRQVFAVPGQIYSPNSAGPNNLLKMGAKLVSEAQDVLEELNLSSAVEYKEARKIIPDNHEEKLILEILSTEPIHIDKIIFRTKLDTATASSTLTLMEMKGKIRNLGGMMYVIAR
ncbi:MAG: protecting protein DprA protein [Parcubacteria group bacterium GW2011_GWF2_39_13b]|nr:MAG: protecting protein DprA protein [Parcubacteria group bacterium GW2011_GWF2_39_13b]